MSTNEKITMPLDLLPGLSCTCWPRKPDLAAVEAREENTRSTGPLTAPATGAHGLRRPRPGALPGRPSNTKKRAADQRLKRLDDRGGSLDRCRSPPPTSVGGVRQTRSVTTKVCLPSRTSIQRPGVNLDHGRHRRTSTTRERRAERRSRRPNGHLYGGQTGPASNTDASTGKKLLGKTLIRQRARGHRHGAGYKSGNGYVSTCRQHEHVLRRPR